MYGVRTRTPYMTPSACRKGAPKEEQIRVQIQFCLRTPSAENGATKPFLDLI